VGQAAARTAAVRPVPNRRATSRDVCSHTMPDKPTPKPTVALHIRVDPEFKAECQRRAAECGLTLTDWLVRVVDASLKKVRKKEAGG